MEQFKNLMIGLFVSAAAIVVVFVLMFIHPSLGDEGKTIHVHFADIDKITIGTRVTYAGRPVGEVVGIEEIERERHGPVDNHGHVYLYDLTLRVDSGVNVYNTDKVASKTSGLLGEKNVEITPYAPQKGEKLQLVDGQVILAEETQSVEDILQAINVAAGKFDTALETINATVDDIRKQKLVEKVTQTVEDIDVVVKQVNRSWPNVDRTIQNISDAAMQIKTAAVKAQDLVTDGKNVIDYVASGQGTLGKIIYSEDLYLRVNSIMSKLETTMDDVNHYGILFHSDKGWQRLRARRLNLLQKLESPQEFRNYFNDEIDQISTSLSRVYMVLNEVSTSPCCENLLNNREYTKVFAELMRRVSMLEEEIRMYNTQVVETRVCETEL